MALSNNEQRKLAFFHALSKAMTENTKEPYEEIYKSSHNVRLSEVWSDDIDFAPDFTSAFNQSLINDAVTYIEEAELDQVFGSNGQAYCFISGGTFDPFGNITPGGQFIRPWIAPTDIPDPITNNPSDGFGLRLYTGPDATGILPPNSQIPPTFGAWEVDYYTGLIHFGEFNTPNDLGWGSIKASFFQYTGNYGASTGATPTDAFTSVIFNSGTSELIFNEGEPTETIVDLSSLKVLTGTTSLLSISNSNMPAEDTNSASPLACNVPLSSNIAGSRVFVFVNGVQVKVGNQITDDCYFSPNGVVKRALGQEQSGDLLYWNYNLLNEPVADYELNTTDRISYLNLIIS